MFELEKIEVKCSSASTNQEKMGGGGETRLGLSLFFKYLGNNRTLDLFDAKLRPALYEGAGGGAQEDFEDDEHTPELKFKFEKPICWPYVGEGYTLTIWPAIEANAPKILKGCKLDRIKFDLKDEGVVEYSFRLYGYPDLKDVGELCGHVDHDIVISLAAPAVQPHTSATRSPDPDSPQQDLLASGDTIDEQDADDDIYALAVALVREHDKATTSFVQRHLKIGYNRAARIVERLEQEGVVTAADTSGQRTVIQAVQQSVLYPRAEAAVRATRNPSTSALQNELKVDFNEALQLLMELERAGVIVAQDGEYVMADQQSAA